MNTFNERLVHTKKNTTVHGDFCEFHTPSSLLPWAVVRGVTPTYYVPITCVFHVVFMCSTDMFGITIIQFDITKSGPSGSLAHMTIIDPCPTLKHQFHKSLMYL